MIQDIIVGIIVLTCAAYLARKYVFKPKKSKKGSCGGCNKCG